MTLYRKKDIKTALKFNENDTLNTMLERWKLSDVDGDMAGLFFAQKYSEKIV